MLVWVMLKNNCNLIFLITSHKKTKVSNFLPCPPPHSFQGSLEVPFAIGKPVRRNL